MKPTKKVDPIHGKEPKKGTLAHKRWLDKVKQDGYSPEKDFEIKDNMVGNAKIRKVSENEEYRDSYEDDEPTFRDGDRVELLDEPGEVFTVSQCDDERGRCWIGDEQDRGWYARFSQLTKVDGNNEDDIEEGRLPQLSTKGADYSKYDTEHLKSMLRPGILHRDELKFKTLIRRELKKREKQGATQVTEHGDPWEQQPHDPRDQNPFKPGGDSGWLPVVDTQPSKNKVKPEIAKKLRLPPYDKEEQIDELDLHAQQKLTASQDVGRRMLEVNKIYADAKRHGDKQSELAAKLKLTQLAREKHDLELREDASGGASCAGGMAGGAIPNLFAKPIKRTKTKKVKESSSTQRSSIGKAIALAEEQLDEINRRDFLKGAVGIGGAAALGAAGVGLYKLAQWDTEQEGKFASYIKDPADMKQYRKMKDEYATYLALSSNKGTQSTYQTIAAIKGGELDDFRQEMAKKYGFKVSWIGNVSEGKKMKVIADADKAIREESTINELAKWRKEGGKGSATGLGKTFVKQTVDYGDREIKVPIGRQGLDQNSEPLDNAGSDPLSNRGANLKTSSKGTALLPKNAQRNLKDRIKRDLGKHGPVGTLPESKVIDDAIKTVREEFKLDSLRELLQQQLNEYKPKIIPPTLAGGKLNPNHPGNTAEIAAQKERHQREKEINARERARKAAKARDQRLRAATQDKARTKAQQIRAMLGSSEPRTPLEAKAKHAMFSVWQAIAHDIISGYEDMHGGDMSELEDPFMVAELCCDANRMQQFANLSPEEEREILSLNNRTLARLASDFGI